jgi:hypothetical protein
MRIQSTVGGAALALAAVITTSAAGRQAVGPQSPSTTAAVPRDIRAILRAHCTVCHAPGGPSPMPFVTDQDILTWTQRIRDLTLTRQMPIWHAARGFGSFRNDPTLTPYELGLIVNWAGGGRDRGQAEPPAKLVAPKPPPGAEADTSTMTLHIPGGWITGWTFVPGDPLITSATFTSADGSTIGAWTAGDRTVLLPSGYAIRVVSPVHVDIRRRQRTSYEAPFTRRESSVRFLRLPYTGEQPEPIPWRRLRIERLACGDTIGPGEETLIGIRPTLAAGANVQVTVERIGGAQPVLLGWFRGFDLNYPRIYWLDRPLDFVANARLTSDAPCQLDLVLSSRR